MGPNYLFCGRGGTGYVVRGPVRHVDGEAWCSCGGSEVNRCNDLIFEILSCHKGPFDLADELERAREARGKARVEVNDFFDRSIGRAKKDQEDRLARYKLYGMNEAGSTAQLAATDGSVYQ